MHSISQGEHFTPVKGSRVLLNRGSAGLFPDLFDAATDSVGWLLKVGALASGAAAWAGETFSVLEHIPTHETPGGLYDEPFALGSR